MGAGLCPLSMRKRLLYIRSIHALMKAWMPCADPESFVRGGPTLITFFGCFSQLLRGKRASECHPKAGYYRSTSETPVIWGRSGPPVPPLDPRMNVMNIKQTTVFVCQRGSNSDNVFGCVFSSWWGKEGVENITLKWVIIGPQAKRQTYGEVWTPCPPPFWIRARMQ